VLDKKPATTGGNNQLQNKPEATKKEAPLMTKMVTSNNNVSSKNEAPKTQI
jgi:hypothetical protein